jgi:hypothetical protein
MSNRLDRDLEEKLRRAKYAFTKLAELGLNPNIGPNADVPPNFANAVAITFTWKGHPVKLYPYSGWHTGKTIKDGRGIENLLKQLK